MNSVQPLLQVNNLQISFKARGGEVQAVRGISFHIEPGEAIAIVGESGCGKSVTAQTIMRLLPALIKNGEIQFKGQNLLQLKEKQMQRIRGKEIGMIFQDPMTSLNPTMTIGKQIAEVLKQHSQMRSSSARQKAMEMLSLVGIPNAKARYHSYPHEFSGGMRQRVMIAIALACQPTLLIADEPTTALDVTIQAQILTVMKDIQQKFNTSIILITHDLGIVADLCDRVIVMYAGKIVETGTKWEIFKNPQHPYTKGLLRSLPRLNQEKSEQLIPIHGTPPDLMNPPPGCGFCARCEHAMNICKSIEPSGTWISEDHTASCWLLHPMAKEAVQ